MMHNFSQKWFSFLAFAWMTTIKADEVPVRKEIQSLTPEGLRNYFGAIRKWHDGEVPANVSFFPNHATFVAYHGSSAAYEDAQGPLDRICIKEAISSHCMHG